MAFWLRDQPDTEKPRLATIFATSEPIAPMP